MKSPNSYLRLNNFSQQLCLPLTATVVTNTHTPFLQIFALQHFVVIVWYGSFKPLGPSLPQTPRSIFKKKSSQAVSWKARSSLLPIQHLLNCLTYQDHYPFSHFHLYLVYTARHLDFSSQLHCFRSF